MVTANESLERLRLRRATLLASATLLAAGSSLAQALRVQPEVETTVVANSTSVAGSDSKQADVALVLNPRVNISSRGGRAALDGTFGVRATTYANNSQDSQVSPEGHLGLRSELIEQLMFLDASLSADRTSADPFAARPEGAATANDYTLMRVRITPYIERQLTSSLTATARTDHIITRRVGGATPVGPSQDTYEQGQTLSLEQRPQPFGWRAELMRQDSKVRGADTSTLAQTSVRLTADYQLTPQVIVGVTAGRERSEYSLIDRTSSIVGGRLDWRPNERGELSARVEHRYFGTGGELAWQQRSTFFGFTVRAARAPAAQTEGRLLGAAGDSVTSLLDAVLTSRYPDAGQRSSAVADIVRQLNLPGTLTRPIDLHTSYAQLQQRASASVLFYGRLTTASLTVFTQRQVRLVDLADVLAPTTFDSDNVQVGSEIEVTRRLTPVLSVNAGLRYNEIEGLGVREGQVSRDSTIRVGVSRILNPATRITAGLRHQNVSSNVISGTRETAVSAALLHLF